MRSELSLVEVAPRDGLQYEKSASRLSLEDKLTFLRMLAQAGFQRIEAGSFVRADAVPQMAGSSDLAEVLRTATWAREVEWSFLVPNAKGLEAALRCEVQAIAVFVATSDAFSLANIRATVDESFARIAPVVMEARTAGCHVRGYLSTIFGGPHGEVITPEKTVTLTGRLLDMGCDEVSLGDTTGLGTPESTAALMKSLADAGLPLGRIALHFHDTAGRAIANLAVAYEAGIRCFDASSGGLGGCPYADSPKGNVAMEAVLDFFAAQGMTQKIDRRMQEEAVRFIRSRLQAAV